MSTQVWRFSALLTITLFSAIDASSAGLPPKVRVLAATNVAHNAAKLKGQVKPNWTKSTTVWFEWGTTTNLGRRSASQSFTGTNWINVPKVIINLTPNTTYYYSLVASNKFGVRRSAITNFTSAQAFPPIVATYPITDLYYTNYIDTYQALLLYGEVNTQGYESDIWFEWGSAPNAITNSAGFGVRFNTIQSQLFSGRIEGLRPNTAYYYRVAARNIFGSAYGDVLSGSTTPGFWVNPYAAQALDATSVRLACEYHSAVGGATQLWFEWGVSTNYGNATLAKDAEGYFTEVISGLPDVQTLYHFRPVATNEFGVVYGRDEVFVFP